MKNILLIVIAASLLCAPQLFAQKPNVIKENLNVEFPTLWNAVKKTLGDIGCRVEVEKNEQGSENLFKGNIRTEFYIIATGEDTTKEVMEKYSCEAKNCEQFPYIRGGVWSAGRIQYKIILKEEKDNTVDFRLEGELSGFESWVTHKVHFWDSNGILEHRLFAKIKANAGLPTDNAPIENTKDSDDN